MRENPRAFRYDGICADWLLSGFSGRIRRLSCVVPGFDNTPRSGWRGILLHRPDLYVFEIAVRQAAYRDRAMPGPRMLFVKSWNEWTEGRSWSPRSSSAGPS